MKYRPNYVSLGLFTPRGPAATTRTTEQAAVVSSETAMENEGGLVPEGAKSSPKATRK